MESFGKSLTSLLTYRLLNSDAVCVFDRRFLQEQKLRLAAQLLAEGNCSHNCATGHTKVTSDPTYMGGSSPIIKLH